jgi:RHS repeat-associated protein
VGNRLNKNTTTRLVGTVANNTHQAITIDAAGNITNDGIRQYRYTAGNQLSSVLVNNIMTQYTYDMNNRRVSKASGTNSTAYTYAEDIGEGSTALSATSLLSEYTATATKEYVYLGDTPIAVVQAGNILTVQTDHLDTPRQLTDNTKKVVWNWAYSAFGENQPTNTNNTVFNLRYPGQYYDTESKLHYNINRYYDPATGRYTQSDPIGLSGGINTYTYVGGNTVRYIDKTGLATYMCTAPLHALGGTGSKSGPDKFGNPLYHQYICITDKKRNTICGGQDQRGKERMDPVYGPGKPSNDSYNSKNCESVQPDNSCIEQCLKNKFKEPRPTYGIGPQGTDCQEWADDTLEICQKKCIKK